MSPLSTIRSGWVLRMRWSAATPTLASAGLAAVNWTSESVANDQSSLPLVVPSGGEQRVGLQRLDRRVRDGRRVVGVDALELTTPSFCSAALVSITCEAVIVIGNFVSAGGVNT